MAWSSLARRWTGFPGVSLARVAQELSFADQSHFQRAFKRHAASRQNVIASRLSVYGLITRQSGDSGRPVGKPIEALFIGREFRRLHRYGASIHLPYGKNWILPSSYGEHAGSQRSGSRHFRKP